MVDCSMLWSNLPKNLCLQKKNKSRLGLNKHVAALLKKWGWKNNFCEIEIVSNKILPQTASFVQKSQPLPKKSFFFLAKKKIKKPLIFASKKKERRVNRSFLGKIATFCWAKKQNKASQKKKSTPINVVSKKKRRANEQNSCSFFTHHNDFVANRIFQHKTKKASKKTSTKKNTKGDENELTRLLSNNKHSFLLSDIIRGKNLLSINNPKRCFESCNTFTTSSI